MTEEEKGQHYALIRLIRNFPLFVTPELDINRLNDMLTVARQHDLPDVVDEIRDRALALETFDLCTACGNRLVIAPKTIQEDPLCPPCNAERWVGVYTDLLLSEAAE